jgi:hypothetical protein
MKLKTYVAFACAAVLLSGWPSGLPPREAHGQGIDLEAAERESELVFYFATS